MIFNRIKEYIRQQMQYIDRTYWVLFFALIIVAIISLFSASSTLAFQKGNGTVLAPILSQMTCIVLHSPTTDIHEIGCRDQRF